MLRITPASVLLVLFVLRPVMRSIILKLADRRTKDLRENNVQTYPYNIKCLLYIYIPIPIIIMCIPYKFRLRYTVVLCNFVLTLHSSPELYTSKRGKITIHNDISLVNEKKKIPAMCSSLE